MQFYKKDDKGEFLEVSDEEFSSVIGDRLQRAKDQEATRVKEELSTKLKEELAPVYKQELTEQLTKTLTEDLSGKIKGEYESKLAEAQKKSETFETQIRQKTIAAEYGFKADLESFLGEGTVEEMRAKADVLKNNNSGSLPTAPDKATGDKPGKTSFVTKVD